jgi:hypothetical protein
MGAPVSQPAQAHGSPSEDRGRDMGGFSIWHILIIVAVIAILLPNQRILERAGRNLAQKVRDLIGPYI